MCECKSNIHKTNVKGGRLNDFASANHVHSLLDLGFGGNYVHYRLCLNLQAWGGNKVCLERVEGRHRRVAIIKHEATHFTLVFCLHSNLECAIFIKDTLANQTQSSTEKKKRYYSTNFCKINNYSYLKKPLILTCNGSSGDNWPRL